MIRAFTLTEVLVVIGILGIIASFSPFVGIRAYQHALTKADIDLVILALHLARSESMHYQCQSMDCQEASAYGVHISETSVLVFEGETYETRTPSLDREFSLFATEITSTATDILFYPNGSSSSATISMRENTSAWSITVGKDGSIETL